MRVGRRKIEAIERKVGNRARWTGTGCKAHAGVCRSWRSQTSNSRIVIWTGICVGDGNVAILKDKAMKYVACQEK